MIPPRPGETADTRLSGRATRRLGPVLAAVVVGLVAVAATLSPAGAQAGADTARPCGSGMTERHDPDLVRFSHHRGG